MFDDALVVSYPATDTVLLRDPAGRAPNPALTALLGPTRAAALVAICRTAALTTSRLAAALGLSAAAASRQATVLRDAGLIASYRDGMTVHHHATRLGSELADGLDVDSQLARSFGLWGDAAKNGRALRR
jgi:DNA-binding transcriptional ArsR family regulator